MAGYDDPRYLQDVIEKLQKDLAELKRASLPLTVNQQGPLPGWIRYAVIEAGRILSPIFEVVSSVGNTVRAILKVSDSGYPMIEVESPAVAFVITPQFQVVDGRDPGAGFPLVQIGDEQNAFDATLTLRRYSSITVAPGATYPVDAFVEASPYPGALGIGAFISRRVGILWGAAGNWGVDASFPFRYHGAPSTITLTQVTPDTLTGGTKSVVLIDYFGFHLQIAGATGGGFTLNRWTASGGT